jgi:hypothetical protein
VDRLEATRPLRSGTIRGILQTRWTPSHSRFLPTTRRRLSTVHECDLEKDASNLTPSQVKSSRVSSQNEILKRHNCVRPFNTPDEHLRSTPASDKAGEQNKTTTPNDEQGKPGRRMGDRLCQSHVRHPDERPTCVVETVDENEDDHRGEKV